MMQKIFITIISLFFLTNSAYAVTRCCGGVPENPYVCKRLQLPCFNSIETNGDVDLQVEGCSYQQAVEIAGRAKSVQSIKIYVKRKTLYIETLARSQMACRAKIRVCVPLLDQFSCNGGVGNIHIKQPYPNHSFCMNVYGKSRVTLNGNIKLRKLIVGGNTELSVYWVNSCDCYLKAMGSARICLAGVAGTLEADALQNAWINARYLRAKRVFVKSYDNSRIDVRAICSLNALASGHSAIYYYQDPRFQAPYMECMGSVVGMTQICCPPWNLCDRACCKNGWH